MEPYKIIAVLSFLVASFAYINLKFFKIPMTIGLMLMSLILSLLLIISSYIEPAIIPSVENIILSIDFRSILLDQLLGILLFAGALHVNLNDLEQHKFEISVFSTIGVLSSTFFIGIIILGLSHALDIGLNFMDCLLFGAIISPTDPIAVLGILKNAEASKHLSTKISGESLFNDGFGVVIFMVLLTIITGSENMTASFISFLLLQEVLGGVLFGLLVGYLSYLSLKSVNNYQVEVMITLSLVLSGYALAMALHLSAPIAIVVAGLLIGNQGRRFAMSETTRIHLDTFWELMDEILNALLFVLIGLEVLVIRLDLTFLMAGLIAVPVGLFARLISISGSIMILKPFVKPQKGDIPIITWAGLRGGISVALALSLPEMPHRELLLTMTFMVVIFSIIIQGLSLQKVVAYFTRS